MASVICDGARKNWILRGFQRIYTDQFGSGKRARTRTYIKYYIDACIILTKRKIYQRRKECVRAQAAKELKIYKQNAADN